MTAPKWGAGFAMVPGWLLRERPSANAVLVYIHLAMHGSFNQGTATYEECRPSKRTLAVGDPARGYPGTGLSESTVARALKELIGFRAIKGIPRFDPRDGSQLPTVYRLVFGSVENETPAQTPMSQVTPPPGITCDMGGRVTDDMGGVSPVTRNLEPTTQTPEIKKKDQNPPALSTSATHYAQAPEVKAGGDSESKEQHPGTPAPSSALEALVAELSAAGHWQPDDVRDVLERLAKAGRAPAEIAQVFRDVAAGKYGPTGSPRRLLRWWPAAAGTVMAEPEPEWVRGPFRHLAPGTPMCRTHQGEPAGACGKCKVDRAAALLLDEPDPAPHPAEKESEDGAAGLTGAALARHLAVQAKTGRAPHRQYRPEAPPAPAGPDPVAAGALFGQIVAAARS